MITSRVPRTTKLVGRGRRRILTAWRAGATLRHAAFRNGRAPCRAHGRARHPRGRLDESFVTSGGKGGQNVNKVATCVVLVHRPTGML